MTSIGTLILNRFNGQEKFSVSEAIVLLYEEYGGTWLDFEIQTEKNPMTTLSDTKQLFARPSAEFKIKVENFMWDNLCGSEFRFDGYDKETEDYLACFYYCEHEITDDNVIKVVERRANRFRAFITASCVDVNYYDASKPPTKIEIAAWFAARTIEN